MSHRHFEDPAEAVLDLKAAGAFVCALETTEGASSLFDVTFPLPPVPHSRHVHSNTEASAGNNNHPRDAGEHANDDPDPAAAEGSRAEGRAGRGGRSAGGLVEDGQAVGDFTGGGGLREGGVVALVLGNEVTGVDERVLGLCDLVVEVSRDFAAVDFAVGLLHARAVCWL